MTKSCCLIHPAIELPHMHTCPLCAQERRRAAYATQQADWAHQRRWAVQGLLRPQEDTT